jgi:putative transcriptional regulator
MTLTVSSDGDRHHPPDRMLQARGMTLSELAGRIDITLAKLSILKTGKARAIRFSTLDAICRELQCTPGDCSA